MAMSLFVIVSQINKREYVNAYYDNEHPKKSVVLIYERC
jgi:hypothetical protein